MVFGGVLFLLTRGFELPTRVGVVRRVTMYWEESGYTLFKLTTYSSGNYEYMRDFIVRVTRAIIITRLIGFDKQYI